MRKQSGKDVVSTKWNGGVVSSAAVRMLLHSYRVLMMPLFKTMEIVAVDCLQC